MRILAISGSLRSASSNSAVIDALALVAPEDILVEVEPSMGELLHFNPDQDGDNPPEAVQELRKRIGEADAIVISSPEYAHGVPGSLKNLLDWLVASFEFPNKPVALIRSSSRRVYADEALREILKTMSADLIENACVTVPVLGQGLDGGAIAADSGMRHKLEVALEAIRSQVPEPVPG